MIDLRTDPMALNHLMEFDHVIEVHADGSITEPRDVYAPDLHDDEISSDNWELMDGYSGQDRYSGPMMHQSEYIGGLMARDILETPGIYVALVNYPTHTGDDPESWAVARLVTR